MKFIVKKCINKYVLFSVWIKTYFLDIKSHEDAKIMQCIKMYIKIKVKIKKVIFCVFWGSQRKALLHSPLLFD